MYNAIPLCSVDFSYTINAEDRPGNTDGILMTIKMDNSYGRQIYFDNSSKIYSKTLATNKWGDWKQIVIQD